jgi:enoyl-CoA hydratase/carnithine racemase
MPGSTNFPALGDLARGSQTPSPYDACCRRALDGIKDTEDIREGVRSFLEKRPPKWQGR